VILIRKTTKLDTRTRAETEREREREREELETWKVREEKCETMNRKGKPWNFCNKHIPFCCFDCVKGF